MWQRHDLLSKHDHLLRLEKLIRNRPFIELNDEQTRLLERFSPEFHERQIEVHYTGELVAVDTFFVGAHKGVWQGVSANRVGLLQPPRLGTALHQAAGDLDPCTQLNDAAIFRIPRDAGLYHPVG